MGEYTKVADCEESIYELLHYNYIKKLYSYFKYFKFKNIQVLR